MFLILCVRCRIGGSGGLSQRISQDLVRLVLFSDEIRGSIEAERRFRRSSGGGVMGEIHSIDEAGALAGTELTGDTPTLRLFSLLELIASKNQLFTLQGLVETTGMPKPTLHR